MMTGTPRWFDDLRVALIVVGTLAVLAGAAALFVRVLGP
jgi:hypothetical protein